MVLGFLLGIYLAGVVFTCYLGMGDPEGRFKLQYALFWPYYLKDLF
jgi:hypothetical protein